MGNQCLTTVLLYEKPVLKRSTCEVPRQVHAYVSEKHKQLNQLQMLSALHCTAVYCRGLNLNRRLDGAVFRVDMYSAGYFTSTVLKYWFPVQSTALEYYA
jgi:hypothetical protein